MHNKKSGLILLANDIILMRMKNREMYPFNRDISWLKKSLSAEAFEKISEGVARVKRLAHPLLLSCCSFGAFFLTLCAQEHEFHPLSLMGFLASGIDIIIARIYLGIKEKEINKSMLSTIYDDLQKNYTDAMLIKSLIFNAPVSMQ